MKTSARKYKTFNEFYFYYLTEHALPINRVLHVFGTALVIAITALICFFPNWRLLIFIPAAGYGFAWTGHFFFEKNKPATFTYPLWSLASDFVMLFHILSGRINEKLKEAKKKIKTENEKI
jgi:hypothetical protein